MYDSLKLYNDLRCLLVHNYSIGNYLALSSEHEIFDANKSHIYKNTITVASLLTNLELGFNKLKAELRENTLIRKNALARYDISPPLLEVERRMWSYSEEEAFFFD